MPEFYDILEDINLEETLHPWKDSLKNGWLKESWQYLLESYPAEYEEDYCESLCVFSTLMAIYVSFTRIAWDSVDDLYLVDLGNNIDVSDAKFGLLASKCAPNDVEFLLSVDNDNVYYYCLQTIIETLRPEVINALEKSYGGEKFLYLSLLKIQMDENFEDKEPGFEESLIGNWNSFSAMVNSHGGDFETYERDNCGLIENVIAGWVIFGCPILWDRLGY